MTTRSERRGAAHGQRWTVLCGDVVFCVAPDPESGERTVAQLARVKCPARVVPWKRTDMPGLKRRVA
jgi:hypothetical protein